jgi:hypothetical protein
MLVGVAMRYARKSYDGAVRIPESRATLARRVIPEDPLADEHEKTRRFQRVP